MEKGRRGNALRDPHILKFGRKGGSAPNRVVYFDSESRVDTDDAKYAKMIAMGEKAEKDHDVYLICGKFKDAKRGINRMVDYHGPDFDYRFWSQVTEFARKRERTWVFAHNARYDVLATGCVPTMVRLGFKVTSFSDDNPFILKFVGHDKTIMILSSTNYYQASLAALGKTFGLPKLDAAYNAPLEDAIVYCRRDVDILDLAMTSFMKFISDEGLGPFCITQASQSFTAFCYRFIPTDIYIHSNEAALKLERAAYYGGRNECWQLGKIPGPVHYVDVNSMYPYVMIHEDYPTKMVTYRNNCAIEDLQYYMDQGYLIVAKVRVDTNEPVYPYRHKRLIFPVGTFDSCLCTKEIQYALSQGHIKHVYEVAVYEKYPIFRDFVTYFYEKRLEAKRTGDKVMDYLYKLIMNSLYGKLGQRSFNWEVTGEADPEIISIERMVNYDTSEYQIVKTFGGAVITRTENENGLYESFNSFPAIAAHVTANARMLIWSYAKMIGMDHTYYTDTDSLFINDYGFEVLKSNGLISQTELGKLGLEDTVNDLELYGLKDYKMNGVVKTKGIPKSAIETVVRDKNGRSRKGYVVQLWPGFTKMLREKNLNRFKNVYIFKTLSRVYGKGYVMRNGRVLPLRLQNNILQENSSAVNMRSLIGLY